MAPPGVTYNVYRSATAPIPVDDAHRIASGLRQGLYLDRGGRAGLYYVVTAQNAAGESGPSNTAQAGPWPKPWPPKPPEPPIPPPIEFHWPDLTLLLPAPLLLMALGRSRRRMRWAAPVGAVLLGVAAVCLAGAVPGSRGAEVQRSAGAEVQRSAGAEVQRGAGAEVQRGAGAEGMVTRTITYTYDPLGRLTGAEYSTGERYEYAYDAVGNRTAYTVTTPLAGTAVTTYTYDAANRLLISSSPQRLITYTWDARGNLIGDGTFTYAYSAAGKMVRAQSITATIAYTYTADGLRVGQRVSSTLTTYTWDWASPVPELLSQSTDSQSTAYLVGHETLGWWDGAAWAYILADGLGSVRQAADGAGAVVRTREWTPYGEEVGGWRAGLGYTGEWQDGDVGLVYLRARWYAPGVGIFTAPDPFPGVQAEPGSLHPYRYVLGNPVNGTDPSGHQCIGCRTPGDWAEFTLFHLYGIYLRRGPSGYTFPDPEKVLILETVTDFANLLGGPDSLKRNLALSVIRQEWATPDGAFNASYSPKEKTITLPPGWYTPIIAQTPNGQIAIILANPCLEEALHFPEGSLPTDKVEAQFVLAHEMGHAFAEGNRRALHSFESSVDLPWAIFAAFNSNPIIARNANRDRFAEEVFADVIAAYLYSSGLLNQQMMEWVQVEMPSILQ